MKQKSLIALIGLVLLTAPAVAKKAPVSNDYPIQPVPFNTVKLSDSFWAPRLLINQEVTIPIALEQCYITGRVDNFKKAAHLMDGYFDTEFTFDDTDIYKIIEGMSYSVANHPNPFLVARMDTLIELIGKAQEPDGYLYTARTAGNPAKMHDWVGAKRWENDPELSHELYNCGHFFEAAAAHFQATEKRNMLDIAIKMADLLVKDFGPGKLAYEPGHQIVEMGLVRMYRVTGKKEYLDLAKYFLDLRGKGKSGEYSQTHKPVIEQDEAVGHAVRATYMYSGMADVAALTGNEAYLHAIDKIWENVAGKKLYITGGIGATGNGEAFGDNYDLPNMSAYCETCAAIGNVYWNYRLFLLHGDAKYYDVLERSLYNGVLSGVSLSGDRFFYPNPLESVGQHARSKWFGCACCPSNMCRFVPSIPGYIYAHQSDSLYINLFVQSETSVVLGKNNVHLTQTTGYPWCGQVKIQIEPVRKSAFTVMIRVPGWVRNQPVPSNLYRYLDNQDKKITLKVNGEEIPYSITDKGYIALTRKWTKGSTVEVSFPMEIKRVIANDKVEEDLGKVSLERGPIVYCLEGPDNNEIVLNTVLEDATVVKADAYSNDLNGCVHLEADALSAGKNASNEVSTQSKHIVAIPYYAWANRGSGEMAVWIPRTKASARPMPLPTISTKAKVTGSIPNKSLSSVNDGYEPKNSNDRCCPFYCIWPKADTKEWIALEFEKTETVTSTKVYWFDDAPWGGCRIPLNWSVQYLDAYGNWSDVKSLTPCLPVKDAWSETTFEPVTTKQIRVLYQTPEKHSAGVYEIIAL
jgi:uncharacterized protein